MDHLVPENIVVPLFQRFRHPYNDHAAQGETVDPTQIAVRLKTHSEHSVERPMIAIDNENPTI
jgi:hypothetical protein